MTRMISYKAVFLLIALLLSSFILLFGFTYIIRPLGLLPNIEHISQSPLGYDYYNMSFLDIFVLYAISTCLVTLICAICALSIGLLMFCLNVSRSPIFRLMYFIYAEFFRNSPVTLLILIIAYFSACAWTVDNSLILLGGDIIINNRGVYIELYVLMFIIYCLISYILFFVIKNKTYFCIIVITLLALIIFAYFSFDFMDDQIVKNRFNYSSDIYFNKFSMPCICVVIFSGLHQGSYVAQTLVASINATSKSQIEASASLGIPMQKIYTKVLMPQAFTFSVPALSIQLLDCVKFAAIAVLIGYVDLYSIVIMVTSKWGSPTKYACIMVIFLVLWSFIISCIANLYNMYITKKMRVVSY